MDPPPSTPMAPHERTLKRVPSFLTESRAFSLISALAETTGLSSRATSPVPASSDDDLSHDTPHDRQLVLLRQSSADVDGEGMLRYAATSLGPATGTKWVSGARVRTGSPSNARKRWSSHDGSNGALMTSTPASTPTPLRKVATGKQAEQPSNVKLSRKHVEMAIRLANDALDEDRKGRTGDTEFTIDCYFSSIDYLLSASHSATVALQSTSSAKRAILCSKLQKLAEELGGSCSPSPTSSSTSFPIDASSALLAPTSSLNAAGVGSWWSLAVPSLRRRTTSAPASRHATLPEICVESTASSPTNTVTGSIQPPTDLIAGCPCGRKVMVRVPQWVLDSATASAAQNCADFHPHHPPPRSWSDVFIAASVGLAVLVKQSQLPSLIAALFSAWIGLLVALDARFELRRNVVIKLSDGLEALVALDKALGVHGRIGEAIAVVWEAGVRAAVAFARAEAAKPESTNVEVQPVGNRQASHVQRAEPRLPKLTSVAPLVARKGSSSSTASGRRQRPSLPSAYTTNTESGSYGSYLASSHSSSTPSVPRMSSATPSGQSNSHSRPPPPSYFASLSQTTPLPQTQHQHPMTPSHQVSDPNLTHHDQSWRGGGAGWALNAAENMVGRLRYGHTRSPSIEE